VTRRAKHARNLEENFHCSCSISWINF